MANIEGTVSIGGVPAHLGVVVTLCFFRVAGADAKPPYDGDPPAEACGDSVEICAEDPGDIDIMEANREWPFKTDRAPGCYYTQVRIVLYRQQGGQLYAQVERFFFGRRSLHVPEEGLKGVRLPVT